MTSPSSRRLVCFACNVAIGGIATIGTPCPFCLSPLVEYSQMLLELASHYDPARVIVREAESGESRVAVARQTEVRIRFAPPPAWHLTAGGGL